MANLISHAGSNPTSLSPYGERAKDPMTRLGEQIKVLSNGCWQFGKRLDSYSAFTQHYGGKQTITPVHRRVYETLVGDIPEGHELHHECENPGCVNPKHLTPLTPGDHKRLHARKRQAS